jgi:hypothetical protein
MTPWDTNTALLEYLGLSARHVRDATITFDRSVGPIIEAEIFMVDPLTDFRYADAAGTLAKVERKFVIGVADEGCMAPQCDADGTVGVYVFGIRVGWACEDHGSGS